MDQQQWAIRHTHQLDLVQKVECILELDLAVGRRLSRSRLVMGKSVSAREGS
jgi:hypothetical protein